MPSGNSQDEISRDEQMVVACCHSVTRDWLANTEAVESFVLSGAGTWMLLALLASGATGEALQELEIAVGVVAQDAAVLADLTVSLLNATPGIRTALGLWASPTVQIRDEFVAAIPEATVGVLPGGVAELDEWVRVATHDLIKSFPIDVTEDTLLVAASVAAAQADWLQPFEEGLGRWNGGGEWVPWLHRQSRDLAAVSIIETPQARVGRVICETDSGFEVHLLTGEESHGAAGVLAAGLDALEKKAKVITGELLRRGDAAGCLRTEKVRASQPGLRVGLPNFEISSSWDLTDQPEIFGLETAVDTSRGHFGNIATSPLAIENAAQECLAGFSAKGFRAAAVTYAAMMAGSGLAETSHTVVSVNLDKPFGFLVVHRRTGLAVFAGWVAEPGEIPPRLDRVEVPEGR